MSDHTLSRTAFQDRVRAAHPGEKITYHVGCIMIDRLRGLDFQKVHSTAKAAWDAMEAGEVRLVQRLLVTGICEYIAVVRKPPHKAVEWEGCYHPEWTKALT